MLALQVDTLRSQSTRSKHFKSQHTHLLDAEPRARVQVCLLGLAFNFTTTNNLLIPIDLRYL
jgi:hypothetical protein